MNKGSVPGWHARWIEPIQPDVIEEPAFSLAQMFSGEVPAQEPPERRMHPSRLLKRVFSLDTAAHGRPVRATMRCTAHGIYEATVNGVPVSADLYAPGYTSYRGLLEYQTYDVTAAVCAAAPGAPCVWSIVLADGWWAGRISTSGGSAQFGNRLAVLGEIEIAYADGAVEYVGTDEGFRSSTGRWVYADPVIGEKQDLRREVDGWQASTDVEGWAPIVAVGVEGPEPTAESCPPVRRGAELAPRAWWREDDAIVVDFGQVIAGFVRIECLLCEGGELHVRHSEVLDEHGRFLLNIVGRNKDQTCVYVGRGREDVLEPHFSLHGFRYARITGWDEAVGVDFDPARITALAVWSAMRETGRIRTSDARLNRLLDNVLWSQRGNMVSIPTDCPQRERAGWTGDMQVFAPTSTFFMDTQAFIRRWLACVRADQRENGEVVDYSPAPRDFWEDESFTGSYSSAGWGDAIAMVPWTLYERYGDTSVLAENYDAMVRWHAFSMASAAEGKTGDDRFIWDTKFHYGDWMYPSEMIFGTHDPMTTARATKDVFATAFLARTSEVLARVAEVLGRADDAARFAADAESVRRAFAARFVREDGTMALERELQGPYVIALAFDLVPEELRARCAERLAELVHAAGNRLDCGFLSVPYLLDVLMRFGYEDLAGTLLMQGECPGWLYEVDRGATTIWENWAGVAPNGKVSEFSFNHYAFGCVADWVVRTVGGLSSVEPGYRVFSVAPRAVGGLTSCELAYESAAGRIEVAWRVDDGGAGGSRLEVTVPAGAKALVSLPGCAVPREVGAGRWLFGW